MKLAKCDNIDQVTQQCCLQLFGFLLFVSCSLFSLLQFSSWGKYLACDIIWTYASISLAVFGYGIVIERRSKKWLDNRRRVDRAEIETLLSEFESYLKLYEQDSSFSINLDVARLEHDNIKLRIERSEDIFELDVLGLRKALVDLYDYCELDAKCDAELRNLKDYSSEIDDYSKIKTKIGELLSEASHAKDNDRKNKYDCEIRSELKKIRELLAFMDKNWAEGEIIIDRHLWISIGFMVGTFLIGILPIIHHLGKDSLGIINWAFLGITGGVFSVLFSLHEDGYTEIGETAGKKVLKRTLSSLVIGGMSAILLYSGLKSGLIAGNAFPKFDQDNLKNSMIAIFWGLFSGISIKIYSTLAGLAEGKIGGE